MDNRTDEIDVEDRVNVYQMEKHRDGQEAIAAESSHGVDDLRFNERPQLLSSRVCQSRTNAAVRKMFGVSRRRPLPLL